MQMMEIMGPYEGASMQIMGAMGLGVAEEDLKALGQQLAETGAMTSAIVAALKPLTAAERATVTTAYLAAGGNSFWLQSAQDQLKTGNTTIKTIWGIASTASFAACVYHGYKRNHSVGWAIGWGVLAALFPVITPVVAVAQGFGKPKAA